MAGYDSGNGVDGSSTSPSLRELDLWILTFAVQVSRTTITLESTNTRTSTTVVLPGTIFKTGTTVRKSKAANYPISPSTSPTPKCSVCRKLTALPCSLATESDYVRGVLAAHAAELLSLGTDGFRIDAAKREEKQFPSPFTYGVTNRDVF
jgi:hypothetical protein